MKLLFILLVAAFAVVQGMPLLAQGIFRDRLQRNPSLSRDTEEAGESGDTSAGNTVMAGLKVSFWKPTGPGAHPLVIFSHGYHGSSTQSKSIMQALSQAGYIVFAPNHKDALGHNSGGLFVMPEQPFRDAGRWNDQTFKKRGDDVVNLLDALRKDPQWSSQIDWSKVALAGHSLGGYTVLALAGAWPSWKLPYIKAVLALSPYCQPFVENGNLSSLGVPVMYQGGTRDRGITPTVRGPSGAFSKTSAPAYFVEFDNAGHFTWTNLNKDQQEGDLINHYAVAFLNKYVKGDPKADPGEKLSGVTELEVK